MGKLLRNREFLTAFTGPPVNMIFMPLFFAIYSGISSTVEHFSRTAANRGLEWLRTLRIVAFAGICSSHCLLARPDQPGRFIPRGIPVNVEFAEALVNFYAPIDSEDLARLNTMIATACDLRRAARGLHYNAVQLYQGEFAPGETRGTFCIWNSEEELIEFGQYDAQGRLKGVYATFYRGKLRSLTAWAPDSRGVQISRGWDWVLNDQRWNVTLAYVKLKDLRPNRTVEYIFERQTGYLIKRKEYIEAADGSMIPRGVHYNGYPSKEYPQCVDYLPDGRTRVIADRCEFEDEIIPGSNRF